MITKEEVAKVIACCDERRSVTNSACRNLGLTHRTSAVGNVRFIKSSNTIVQMESAKRVVIQGIHDCILSEKNDHFLISHRSEEQRIKEFSAE